ncbi:hypothetical protein CHLNCDRAFT_138656 [Chlorella variabilis]|uniref:CobW C-terminal domain-containing protein n=1 Tax=Chlorella variabilis TaxID=554065 RepID=E1ZNH2_CHLVA|nr:hypothetical protein CHLNCDRAFT_138656 [Chlorella variabilis]EFN52681.1 hypothetical protein CHLNCDRAFT_138656 [Chlorella variabilis]|eukprot:XP_005844783.1 hypothetical protein CHLNCDRAFT_138656 [Chlorella variabilis]
MQPSSALQRHGARCAAAVEESDAIDVEGKVLDDRVPVTVITGFLGSGKTTLLNQILGQDHGYRIAVIENEYGQIDIDSDLVAVEESLDPGAEQIMMLNNGCLCCTVRDDLVSMLNTLYDRRSQFDRIVIETTGLAQPAPIIQTFFLEPSVSDRMRLDGVVTLVDAKHVELHLDEQKPEGVVNEALEQIAYADRVVLNKTDLVAEGDLARLEERIRGINSMAEVRRAQRADVPVDHKHHDDAVGSVSVTIVGDMDLDKVNYWLGGLIEVKSNDLYRMKGVLAIKDFDKRFGVHMLFEGMPDRPWKEGELRVSKMVFIGKDLDRALIEEGFRECIVKE